MVSRGGRNRTLTDSLRDRLIFFFSLSHHSSIEKNFRSSKRIFVPSSKENWLHYIYNFLISLDSIILLFCKGLNVPFLPYIPNYKISISRISNFITRRIIYYFLSYYIDDLDVVSLIDRGPINCTNNDDPFRKINKNQGRVPAASGTYIFFYPPLFSTEME